MDKFENLCSKEYNFRLPEVLFAPYFFKIEVGITALALPDVLWH